MTIFIFEQQPSTKLNDYDYHSLYQKNTKHLKNVKAENLPDLYKISALQKKIQLSVHEAGVVDHFERKEIEEYISLKYQEKHNATLTHFSSTLFVGMYEDQTQVAIGIEQLKTHKAFLEQYLEQPIEQSLQNMTQRDVSRSKIVEIGNLASENMEYAKMIVAFLVFYLSLEGVEWAVCTGTIAVRYVLQQMGLHFHVLEKANPDVLGEAKKQWGNYYEQKPLVLAINVAESLSVTQKNYDFNVGKITKTGGFLL
ncbi:thermostable hemolysin [Acinetobacter sp. BSP-153]|uniref:thermostable hemolysin n=1 Tax=Acinetobacter sp. BSP-153 TaxID=3344663 RepID=UPI00376FE9B3